MGKRKIKGTDFNHFGGGGDEERNRDEASYEETNAAFFGQFMDMESVKPLRVEQIDIFSIRPDLAQPRRTIPSALRRSWMGNPNELKGLFEQWIGQVNQDRDAHGYPPFNLMEAIEMVENELPSPSAEHAKNYGDEHPLPRMWVTERGVRIDPRDLAKAGISAIDEGIRPEELQTPNSTELKIELSKFSTEAALMHVITLAASIKQSGLINPITLVKDGNGYVLETGERRWLSYHLLYLVYGEDSWRKIPARVVKQFSIWRQASENNARQDLNAIAKARQLALLVMDMYQAEGHQFTPITQFNHEQEFYAQVADGEKWRIKRGEGQKILSILALKDPVQIRQYRSLLRMAQDMWEFADDNNISEYELREMIRIGFVPVGNRSGDGNAPHKPDMKRIMDAEPEVSLFNRSWHKLAQRQRDLAKKLPTSDRHKMAIMLRQLADEIEKMK